MTAQIQEKTKGFRGFRSLKVSLIFAFLVVGAVILVITSTLELIFNFNILRQAASNQQQMIAQEAANTVKSFIQEKFRILETGINLGDLTTSPGEQQRLMLNKLLGLEPSFRQLLLLNSEGKELTRISRLSQTASSQLSDQITPDVLTDIRQSERYISPVYIDEVTSEPMVTMAVPATDIFGDYQGTLITEVNLKFMWDLVDKIEVGKKGLAYVVDRKGNLIAFSDVSRVLAGENLLYLAEVDEFVEEEGLIDVRPARFSKGIQSNYVVATHVPLDNPDWAVVVELPASEAYQDLILIIGLLALVTFLGFVSAVVSGVILSGRIARPIVNLRNAASELSQGKLETRIEIESVDEIGQLGQAFNQMASQLHQSYQVLEQKVADRTQELNVKLSELEKANKGSGEAKTAMLNLLEDARVLEEELKEERDRAKAILTSMGDGLIVVDKNSKVVLLNDQAAQLLELDREKSVSQMINQLFFFCKKDQEFSSEENPLIKIFQSPKQQTIVMDLEDDIYFRTASGKRFPVALVVTPLLTDSSITGAILVFRDISTIKQLDEAKTGFISVASHQLRTPLTSMRWFSEMLIGGDAGKITEEQKHFVERIYEGTDRMIALVNLLLQIARVEAGRVKIEPVPVDLKATTQGVMLTLKNQLDQKSQQVSIKTEPDPFPSISLDQEVIWQVIQNLLSNASRYSPEKATISVSIIQKGDLAQYSVKDQGIGIPKEQQKRVFEKFFRAENALKMVPEGSGLGLSLVKLLVEGWGGKVWFETEEGKGSTFYFTIPLSGVKPRTGEVKLAV